MPDNWLTEEGERGDLIIKKQDGGWFATSINDTVQCILKSSKVSGKAAGTSCTVNVTVDKYKYSSRSGPDMAILDLNNIISVSERSTSSINLKEKISSLEKADSPKNVYYKSSVLREWKSGSRFYANGAEKYSYGPGEPYFDCDSNSNLWQNNFGSEIVSIETGDTGKRKYSLGKLHNQVVIISLGPERHWEK